LQFYQKFNPFTTKKPWLKIMAFWRNMPKASLRDFVYFLP